MQSLSCSKRLVTNRVKGSSRHLRRLLMWVRETFAHPRSAFSTLKLLFASTQRDEMLFHRGGRTHARVLWKWEKSLSQRRKWCCGLLSVDPGSLQHRATLWICLLYVFAKSSSSNRETTMSNYAYNRSFGGAVQLAATKLNYRVTTIVKESLCPGNSWQAAMASRQA